MAKLHGKDGDVVLGGENLQVKEWTATVSRDEHDTTNKASGGNQEMQLGIKRLEGSFKAEWELDLSDTGVPPFDTAEPQETTIKLEIGKQVFVNPEEPSGQSYLECNCVVSSLEITSAHDGIIEYSGNFKSVGAITHELVEA